MNKNIVVAIIIIVAVLAAGWWWFNKKSAAPPGGEGTISNSAEATQNGSLGASIYNNVSGDINPADKLPEANPFAADANPIKDAYQNPFGQ